jgi:GNAT superfamily N-acetyltransferase
MTDRRPTTSAPGTDPASGRVVAEALHIAVADTDEQILRCHAVLAQLRPHVPADGFVDRVRRMQRQGFRLAYAEAGGAVRAVAGYRLLDQLFAGLVLYVDDLVTDAAARSQGHGAALLRWLEGEARAAGCEYVELDSGVQRAGAHRFYFREGLAIIGYHFRGPALREAPDAAPAAPRGAPAPTGRDPSRTAGAPAE